MSSLEGGSQRVTKSDQQSKRGGSTPKSDQKWLGGCRFCKPKLTLFMDIGQPVAAEGGAPLEYLKGSWNCQIQPEIKELLSKQKKVSALI